MELERDQRKNVFAVLRHDVARRRGGQEGVGWTVTEQVAPRPAPACPSASPPLSAFRQPAPAGFRLGSRGHDLVPRAVSGFLPHNNRQAHAQVLWNTDMAAWTGHSADIVNWAMHTIQAEHAQQLFVDCTPRVAAGLNDVRVLVVELLWPLL